MITSNSSLNVSRGNQRETVAHRQEVDTLNARMSAKDMKLVEKEAVCSDRTDYENLLPATINLNA